MCLVKNESDVIAQTLETAARWSDFIYVYDNGSDDGTWELVQKLAKSCPKIVPYKQQEKPFRDSLRAEIFNAYRDMSAAGDWWCRLDADEFYVDDPRVFLANVPKKYDVVWTANLSYYFTDKDAELYRADPSMYGDNIPVEQKCRYYLNHWSESRFFRYHPGLLWKDGGYPWMTWSARAYPARIKLKHFPYRSPQQIDRRLLTRRPAIQSGEFVHEAIPNWAQEMGQIRADPARGLNKVGVEHAGEMWEERIVDAASLDHDAHDGSYVLNEDLMPPIYRPPLIRRIARRLILSMMPSFLSAATVIRSWAGHFRGTGIKSGR
jgi:Glycosyl transferase family 2